MENRKRNTAILLIVTGLFLLFGKTIGFFTLTGIFIIMLAALMFRKGEEKLAYILFGVGILMIASKLFFFLVPILCLVGYFFYKTSQTRGHANHMQKNSVLESWKQVSEPWVLQNISRWSAVGEINLDLSLAINESDVTTMQLEGIIGDIDLIVPEDVGLSVDASIMIGEVKIGRMKESGIMNNTIWHSPNYEASDTKVDLKLSYIIGDVDIKLM